MVKIQLYTGFRERLGRDSIEVIIEEAKPLREVLKLIPELWRLIEEYEERRVPYAATVDGRNVFLEKGLEEKVLPNSTIKLFTYVSGGFTELYQAYQRFRDDIRRRLEEFNKTLSCGSERVLLELLFCICTPQNRAVVCWDNVRRLYLTGLHQCTDPVVISKALRGVRFHNQKARYMASAIKQLGSGELDWIFDRELEDVLAREWLVKNVLGLGYKEASHFLRNIGYSLELAILDRHILKWMAKYKLVNEVPKTLSRRRYLELELRFRWFANMLRIHPAELDLLLWAMETGYVFK